MSRFDTLPDALRLLREQRGLSQRQVAEKIGVEPSVVGSWERGKRPPPTDRFFQLADLYDLDLGDLDDALEMAGSSPRRSRRRVIAVDDVTPHRLAGLLLGGEDRDPFDPVEGELEKVLGSVLSLAHSLRRSGGAPNGH